MPADSKKTSAKPERPADTGKIDAKRLDALGEYISSLKTTEGALIEILHHAQGVFGYLPREVQLYIARKLNIPGAEVYGAVSFYSFFRMEPPGKHSVSICMGTACFVRGGEKILNAFKEKLGIEAGETTPDKVFTLKDVRCVGACGLAPVVIVDGEVFGRVTEEDTDKIIAKYRQG